VSYLLYFTLCHIYVACSLPPCCAGVDCIRPPIPSTSVNHMNAVFSPMHALLPAGPPPEFPHHGFTPPRSPHPETRFPAVSRRRQAVVAAMRHAWGGYVKYAWGHDELDPVGEQALTTRFCRLCSYAVNSRQPARGRFRSAGWC